MTAMLAARARLAHISLVEQNNARIACLGSPCVEQAWLLTHFQSSDAKRQCRPGQGENVLLIKISSTTVEPGEDLPAVCILA